jgi:hypothetical protein
MISLVGIWKYWRKLLIKSYGCYVVYVKGWHLPFFAMSVRSQLVVVTNRSRRSMKGMFEWVLHRSLSLEKVHSLPLDSTKFSICSYLSSLKSHIIMHKSGYSVISIMWPNSLLYVHSYNSLSQTKSCTCTEIGFLVDCFLLAISMAFLLVFDNDEGYTDW